MIRDAERYQALFTENEGEIYAVRAGLRGYRVKTIRAGETLEAEAYPIWSTARQAQEAKQQTEKHREAVRAVNLRNRQKQLRWLVNANFGNGDLFVTLTYDNRRQPENSEAAQRDVQNYLRRVARRRERLGLEKLKYIYTTERTEGVLGIRYHHHIIMNGGIERTEAERIWTKGIVNSRTCQADDNGLAGLAHYMTKKKATQEKARRHGFCCSRNLKQPRITYADHKITRGRMAKIAEDLGGRGAQILEAVYPGYRVTERPEVRWSAWAAGVIMQARMIRRT